MRSKDGTKEKKDRENEDSKKVKRVKKGNVIDAFGVTVGKEHKRRGRSSGSRSMDSGKKKSKRRQSYSNSRCTRKT